MNVMPRSPFWGQHQDISFSFWAENIADGELAVTAFAVDEVIFGMTKIEVMLSSENPDLDLSALIDCGATMAVHHKYLETIRFFSGVVVEAERGNEGLHRTAYRMVLLPALYRLDHGSDCRIFQHQNVPEIVRTVLSEYGVHDVVWKLSDEHLIREFCVQYRETHLAFIERIMAEEGIFYYFEHQRSGKHTLVIVDRPEIIDDCPGQPKLDFNALASGVVKGVYCSSLNYRKKLRATSYTQRDYSFKNPTHNFEQRNTTSHPGGEKNDYEMFDYPGRFKQDNVGKSFTRYKLEAARVDASIVHGLGNAPHLIAGHGFLLREHPDAKLNQKWRLLTVRHEGVQPQAWGEDAIGPVQERSSAAAPALLGATLAGLSFGVSGTQSPGLLSTTLSQRPGVAAQFLQQTEADSNATLYACAFSAQPAQLPYRPPQVAKPLVDGPQVAIVVGPPGEQIYTDEYGRVKVQFPWDRHKERGAEDSSCWIRVSQPWGGGNWGNISIPRVGHEVIVEFLEGDPDQPIIMGRTYHANNHTPYKLPAHKTKMAIRSDTHKGDGGFNELSFEDEKGQENLFMHAERDQTIKVKNNQTQRIDANSLQAIGKNQAIEVGNNVNHQVGGGFNQVVGAVGTAALGILGNVLQGLMGQSATLLQQGMALAAKAMQSKGSSGGDSQPAAPASAAAASMPQSADTAPQSAPTAEVSQPAAPLAQSQPAPSDEAARAKIAAQNAAATKSGMKPMMSFASKGSDVNTASAAGATSDAAAPATTPSAAPVSPSQAPMAESSGLLARAASAPVSAPPVPVVSPLSDDVAAFSAEAASFSNVLASGGIVGGLSTIAKGFEVARNGINNASQFDLRSEGGASMAGAASGLAENVEDIVGSGVFNQLVSKFHNTTTGIAATEQVGQVKVSTVGQVSMEKVGHTKQIEVGKELIIKVGKSRFIMREDGTVMILGTHFNFTSSGPVQINGVVVDINKPGGGDPVD